MLSSIVALLRNVCVGDMLSIRTVVVGFLVAGSKNNTQYNYDKLINTNTVDSHRIALTLS